MSDNVSVTLGGMGDRARAWIASGRYASMSEVVREGLRALERQEAEFDAILKAKVQEALADDRPGIPLDHAFDCLESRLRHAV